LAGVSAGGLAALALPARAAGEMARFKKAATPKPLPDLAFQDADDKPLRFADFRGRALLINFWATWCAPCVKEMPSLDRLQAMFPENKFLILPLSIDGPTRPKVAPFYKDQKLTHLGIYFDKGRKAMQALDVSLLPTSILVDPTGRELGRLEGDADWDMPEGVALMKAAIAGQS
jgi:thiol-disulfide isomerase/thioredoxin